MRNSTFNPSAILAEKIFKPLMVLLLLFVVVTVQAQDLADGQAAIEEAADGIEGYFDSIQTLTFIMAGIIALLGSIRVFMKWQMGDPDVMSSAASWFGSAIFLIVAVTVIQSFFGIGFILPLFDAALNLGSMFLDTMTAFLKYMSSYLEALPSFEISYLSSITPSKLTILPTAIPDIGLSDLVIQYTLV